MIPHLQPYPKYKDSGIEWLGQVPENWEITRNKSYLRYRKDTVGDSSDSYILLSLTLKGIIKRDMDNPQGKFPAEFNSYKIVKPGDLIFCLFDIDETPRTVGLSSYNGMITGAYDILYSENQKIIDYLYLYYLAIDNGKGLRPLYSGLRKVVPKDVFMSMKIALPSEDEQVLIVRYLKYTNSRIQQYIAAKQKLIKLLEEQKQAIIHQAVTGAIDVTTGKPYPKYKDSGVEWLGRVPEGWEVRKLKYSLKENLKYGANESGLESMDNWPRYIRITDFDSTGKLKENNYLCLHPDIAKDFLLSDGDILFARSGATVGKTFQFKIGQYDDRKYCFAGYLIKATPNPLIVLSDYLYNFTNSLAFANWKNSIFNKATIENIGADKYALLNVLLPSTKKQRLILDYILEETEVINKTIDRAKREIELLKEYRVRLTADVVTGKADVRELAKNLPTDVTDSIVDDPNDDYVENTEMITEVIEE